ncbi:MAG: AAA family ATPase, partial [Rhodobacteraceae bacterium]|nr:AAA family ATPase [Paracoccaceae bacterium]
MRLRALHLENVRRFAGQRLSVTGIGDGITVIAEPNEFGKSTLFDALHALMFAKYSGRPEPVRALQPYAGGAVTVRAEVETDAGRFSIEKRFLSRAMARVTRLPDDAVQAQEDAAETWITQALGGQGKGPAGMLWVRQGQLGLEPEKPAERTELTETRRDLLSSVAGEIDAMTGGRRMDRVRRQVGAALADLTTATGRPTAAWKEARERVTALEGDLTEAEARVADLAGKLAERASVEARARRMDDPAADTRRRAARSEARAALEAAQAHAGKLRAAELARDLARQRAKAAQEDLDRFLAALNALESARKAAADSATAAQTAAGAVATARTTRDSAQAESDAAEAALQAAQRALAAARTQVEARKARARAAELSKRLEQVEAAQQAQDAAAAQVQRLQATPDRLARIEALEADLAAAEAAARAQTATLRLEYAEGARPVLRDGAPLPGGADLPVDGALSLTLPGIGTLHLTAPAPGAEAAATQRAARTARDAA